MNQFGFPESDWKLYKSKIADWQEGYMEKLCKEYIALLSSDPIDAHVPERHNFAALFC